MARFEIQQSFYHNNLKKARSLGEPMDHGCVELRKITDPITPRITPIVKLTTNASLLIVIPKKFTESLLIIIINSLQIYNRGIGIDYDRHNNEK